MYKLFIRALVLIGISIISSSFASAADCEANADGFYPCAEGRLSTSSDEANDEGTAEEGNFESMDVMTHQPPPRRRYRRVPPVYPRPPYYPPYPPAYPTPYPPVYPGAPAPLCYTPVGSCWMAVAAPAGVPCTCQFGFNWAQGVTGY